MKKHKQGNKVLSFLGRDRLFSMLIVIPTLCIVILSAVYQLTFEATGEAMAPSAGVLMAVLSLLSILASATLGIIYKRRFALGFLTVLFLLCLIAYAAVRLGGTTDLLDDGFFEKLTLVFTLPIWSYYSLGSALFRTAGGAALLTGSLTALLCFVCGGGYLYTVKQDKKAACRKTVGGKHHE